LPKREVNYEISLPDIFVSQRKKKEKNTVALAQHIHPPLSLFLGWAVCSLVLQPTKD
jgi:hypothetical protein